MDILGKTNKIFYGLCLAFLLMIAQIGCQHFDKDADTSFVEDNNTFKLTYALNWQVITIGTFVDNELVDEQFITSSQNPISTQVEI